MSTQKLQQFVQENLIDILVEESEGRGRNANEARKMLLNLYSMLSNDLRTQELKNAQDLMGLENVSYDAIAKEMDLRGLTNAGQSSVEINLPPIDLEQD